MSISTVDVKVSTIYILNAIAYDPPMRVRYFKDVYGGKKGAKELAIKHCAAGDIVFRETQTSAAGNDFEVFGTCSRESYSGLVLKTMKVAELHPEQATKEVDVSTVHMDSKHGMVAVRQYRNNFKEKDEKRNVKQGAQSVAIQHAGDNIVFIRLFPTPNGKGFRVWYTCPPSDFVKLLEQDNQLYEVIHKFPSKVYFDIEKYGIYPELFEESKAKIRELIPGAVLVESGGITYDERTEADVAAGKPDKSKTSYHFILNSHLITDERERKTVQDIALILKNDSLGGDETVYGSNRGMKCVN